jgi:histidine kinase
MKESYTYNNELLFVSSNTVVSKGKRNSDGLSILIKKPANSFPSNRLIESFKKDFHTTQMLYKQFPEHFVNMIEMLEQENGSVVLIEQQDGDSMTDFLKKKGNLNMKEFLKYAISMAKALGETHSLQILHRDIKLGNFILGANEEEVKLIDFGLSVIISTKSPSIPCNSPTGTYAYMSPEQTGRISKNIDFRSDIYSLGITFYELLTGSLPFKGDKLSLVHSHIAKKLPDVPNIPFAVNSIFQKMCQKSPSERYSSASGVFKDLEFISQHLDSLSENFEAGKEDVKQFQIPNKM